jgi:3-phenylpropionate/cinnamic acid dioxygenase small subunit
MAGDKVKDPSRESYYISDEFYEALVGAYTGWDSDDVESHDPGLRETCRMFLEKEARYLDQGRLDDWLGLFAPECAYWIPATSDGGDPRTEITIAFDDRRQLESRVYRLNTGHAWSQQPVSRTSRMVSNVTVFETADLDISMVRSNFTIAEIRAGETRQWAGWCGHRLHWIGDRWEILVKQVNLIDCDQNLRNPSLIL